MACTSLLPTPGWAGPPGIALVLHLAAHDGSLTGLPASATSAERRQTGGPGTAGVKDLLKHDCQLLRSDESTRCGTHRNRAGTGVGACLPRGGIVSNSVMVMAFTVRLVDEDLDRTCVKVCLRKVRLTKARRQQDD